MGSLYDVLMQHDAGRIVIRTYADTPERAAQLVADSELAPIRAVVSVTKVD